MSRRLGADFPRLSRVSEISFYRYSRQRVVSSFRRVEISMKFEFFKRSDSLLSARDNRFRVLCIIRKFMSRKTATQVVYVEYQLNVVGRVNLWEL